MEYLEAHPGGYRYSQFCEHCRRWARKLSPTMRQVHRAGERVFLDFSGVKAHLVDRATGELVEVELFVAVLGAGSYTYAEAVESQELSSWCGAHMRMLEYFGGVPEIFVPDNLKAAILAVWSAVVTASATNDGSPLCALEDVFVTASSLVRADVATRRPCASGRRSRPKVARRSARRRSSGRWRSGEGPICRPDRRGAREHVGGLEFGSAV